MRENVEAALRRQTMIRLLGLTIAGIGRCPDCHQRAEVFARQSVTPGPAKECCLDCWKAQRYAPPRQSETGRGSAPAPGQQDEPSACWPVGPDQQATLGERLRRSSDAAPLVSSCLGQSKNPG